jgi:uncharacterized membrane protein YbaN (DUF454 family)
MRQVKPRRDCGRPAAPGQPVKHREILFRMRKSRHQSRDYSDHVRKHPSPSVRAVLVLAGTGFVVVGLAGVFLPVLPTTPFLLLAAACYARASRRFYNALLNNRLFGPSILEWQQHRAIPWRTKLTAIALLLLTLAISIVFFLRDPWLRLALALFGLALAAWLWRIPSRDAPGRAVADTEQSH